MGLCVLVDKGSAPPLGLCPLGGQTSVKFTSFEIVVNCREGVSCMSRDWAEGRRPSLVVMVGL